MAGTWAMNRGWNVQVMWLDWDQTVTGIASQPFRLWWTAREGKTPSHVPDYFAERAGGPALVVDCRPADRRPPRDLAAFEATRRACVPGRVGVPANRRPGPGCHGEPAVAGRVPAPAVRHTGAGRGGAGRIRRSCPAGGRGGGCGRPGRGAAGAVSPAVAAGAGGRPVGGERGWPVPGINRICRQAAFGRGPGGSRTALARTWYLGAVRRRYRSLVPCIRAVGLY